MGCGGCSNWAHQIEPSGETVMAVSQYQITVGTKKLGVYEMKTGVPQEIPVELVRIFPRLLKATS